MTDDHRPASPAEENAQRSALFTDLYQLTMARGYHVESMNELATFELFFRRLPRQRRFVVAAGLADVLDYLEHWRFTESDLAYLRQQPQFDDDFLDVLAELRFTGDVYAVPEGTVVFENEPIAQVVAPIMQAQLVETFILNQVHFQSIAATKAARVMLAAEGRKVVDFGSRRAHGTDAALKVARCSYLAGAVGTSNVLAGKIYDIPIFGTMAHSYIQAHDDELETFAAFAELYPETTLLVDTYDTLEGVEKVIALARRLGDRFAVKAIRLDSGDLLELARQSRKMLDEAGLQQVRIFASSSLDEHAIAELLRGGAPIDAFGVGTKLAVSPDAPDLDMAYKLVEYAGRPRLKLSSGKTIFPDRKQVFRTVDDSRMTGDLLARHDEQHPGQPLLELVMRSGERLSPGRRSLEDARRHCLAQLDQLPETLRSLAPADEPQYPVQHSSILEKERDTARDLARSQAQL